MKLTPAESALETAIFKKRFNGRHDGIKQAWFRLMKEKEIPWWRRIVGKITHGKNWEHVMCQLLDKMENM